jgi:hypothetical protein
MAARHIRRMGLWFALWVTVALFFYSRTLLWSAAGIGAEPISRMWLRTLISAIYRAAIWTCFTPILVWLARRFPLARARDLAVHAMAGSACAAAALALHLLRIRLTQPERTQEVGQYFLFFFHTELFFYLLGIGAIIALQAHRQAQEQALAAARLRTGLATAELETMRMRIDPHLTFSVLSAIRRLLGRDSERADALVSSFGDLLRSTLRTEGSALWPLDEELEALSTYLEIKDGTFSEGLGVYVHAGPEVRDALVPAFILQASVEWTLEGAEGDAPRCGVGIDITRTGQQVLIQVHREAGLPETREPDAVRRRLNALYPEGSWQLWVDPASRRLSFQVPFHRIEDVPWLPELSDGFTPGRLLRGDTEHAAVI